MKGAAWAAGKLLFLRATEEDGIGGERVRGGTMMVKHYDHVAFKSRWSLYLAESDVRTARALLSVKW